MSTNGNREGLNSFTKFLPAFPYVKKIGKINF
jgi:hypothetical protein